MVYLQWLTQLPVWSQCRLPVSNNFVYLTQKCQITTLASYDLNVKQKSVKQLIFDTVPVNHTITIRMLLLQSLGHDI